MNPVQKNSVKGVARPENQLTKNMETETIIPKLGRLIQFDEKSREYPIRTLLPEARPLRSYTWRCNEYFDQGQEGACVGFSWAHQLAARPSEVFGLLTNNAKQIYKKAQTLDQFPGEDYDGTSVLAGVKAAQSMFPSRIESYKWAFTLNEVLQSLCYVGPVVLGIDWHMGMVTPTKNGMVRADGDVIGGHAILAMGIDPKRRLVRLHNSWGKKWGVEGRCLITFDDLERLLKRNGEACIAIKTKTL